MQQVIEVATTTEEVAVPVAPSKLCNCYQLVVHTFTNVPRMAELKRMASPAMGNVAVFDYPVGPHVALVTGQGVGVFYIREWNYDKCKETTREIPFSDPRLVGFVTLE